MKILIALITLVLMAGCGHNVLTYTTGKFTNLGYDPNAGKIGLQYGNGEQFTVVEKDNAKLTLESTDSLDANGKITAKTTKITYEIKEQITGSDVDLEKVKKDGAL